MFEEYKSLRPTIIVGLGGTGAEVLSRVRRLIEERYGNLDNIPIVSFLWIDTDKWYKVSNPEAAGSPFKDSEKCWVESRTEKIREIYDIIEGSSWISDWFPAQKFRFYYCQSELNHSKHQIRILNRLAFFLNYQKIKQDFLLACDRIQNHEQFMSDRYGIEVKDNLLNIFVVSSLTGGTGSGMLIDLAYCIRHWLQEKDKWVEIMAMLPMPNACVGIGTGEHIMNNAYAALMELSYFSDERTKFEEQYSQSDLDSVRSRQRPFDSTFLLNNQNNESKFSLSQIRELIAQQIYLDLIPTIYLHQVHIRDSLRASSFQTDAEKGRGYSRQFMSFGLSSIEIPISQIYAHLSNRLARDIINSWISKPKEISVQIEEKHLKSLLTKLCLTQQTLLISLSSYKSESIVNHITRRIDKIRNDIFIENRLQCTQKGARLIGNEQGKILEFTDYLQEKANIFFSNKLSNATDSSELNNNGEYLSSISSNKDEIISGAESILEAELYSIVENNNRGASFAKKLIDLLQTSLDLTLRSLETQQKQESQNTNEYSRKYEESIQNIEDFKNKYGLTKQARMEQCCEIALSNLEAKAKAIAHYHSCLVGMEVISQIQESLQHWKNRLNRFQQRTNQLEDYFNTNAQKEADSADALQINGIKLYDRTELNSLYQDLIEQLAGAYRGSKTLYEQGIDSICTTVSEDVLKKSSPLWKETRNADEIMRLLDLTEVPDVNQGNLEKIIYERSKTVIEQAPQDSRLKRELAACDRIFKAFNDENEITDRVRAAYQKSQPLMILDEEIIDKSDFKPSKVNNVAVLGGIHTSDPAAQKMLPIIQQFVPNPDSIKTLDESEKHRIIFTQQISGFSLRCIKEMRELRQSYQQYLEQSIRAKRAKLEGECKTPPIPVHITKEVYFWDIFPEEPKIYEIVVQAKALNILFKEENGIFYNQQTSQDAENIYLASCWDRLPYILEISSFSSDLEEIKNQVNSIYENSLTESEKESIYKQFFKYLTLRAEKLERLGGKDSMIYAREKNIIREVTEQQKLITSKNQTQTYSSSASINEAYAHEPESTYVDTQQNTLNSKDVDRLKRLTEMYMDGLISKEEFEILKRKFINQC